MKKRDPHTLDYTTINGRAALKTAMQEELQRSVNNPNERSKWRFVQTGPSCGYVESLNGPRPNIFLMLKA